MARPYKGWSVFYRGDKRRWVLSRDGRQKLLPGTIKNKREAVNCAHTWLIEQGFLEDDGTAKRTDETDTVSSIADWWVKFRETNIGKPWESATVSNNRSHVKHHIKPHIGHVAVADVTPRIIANCINALTCAVNTKRNVYRSLVAMFDDAIGQGKCKLEHNPAKGHAATSAVPDALTKAQEVEADTRLSLDEYQRLISDPRIPLERRVKYVCALTMVSRDGEIMGLSWGALNFDARSVRIFQTAKIRRYAADKSTGKPKTKKSRRTLPLHEAAAQALRDWLAASTPTTGDPPTPDSPVFPGRDGESFTRVKAAAQLRDDLQKIGIRTHVDGIPLVFHHLRHTALNVLREAGVPAEVRDQLAGHSSKGTGEGTYQHRTVEELRPDVDKIAIVWAGARGSFSAGLGAEVTTTPEGETLQ